MFNSPSVSPEYEEQRLSALYSYDILGEALENELDNLVKLAAQIANVPMAYISFVDRENIILKSAFGIGPEYKVIPRNVTVCQHTMMLDKIFLVPNVSMDPELAQHSMLSLGSGIQFYASAPLKDADGFELGCLVLLDNVARDLTENQIEALETLAVQVIAQLTLKRKNMQLKAQAQRFDEFIDIFTVSPEIHCILDRNGGILFINNAVTPMLQYTVEEVVGKSIWNYCYRDDVDRIVYALEKGLRKKEKQFRIDFRLVSKAGDVRWISWGMVAKEQRWYCYGRDITEDKKVEQELTKLSFVASKVNNGVVINDPQNNVTWVNEAFEKITGFNLEDLKGKPLGDLISGPETDWSLIENARKLTRQKQSFTVDILAYRKDKQKIWLSIYNTVVLDIDGKVETEVEIIIDITDKKKAEEELQILSLVASKTDTGVAITNERGEITWVNEALENLVGYSLDELSGKMLGDLLSTEDTDRTVVDNARKKAKNKQAYTIEVLANKKDGSPIWLSVANTPIINALGQLERQVELIYDITKRKQVEKEILESREHALQLSEAKEMFLSVMSHEIRTPLNAVIGMTHLLLDNNPKASQINDLNILKFSGENLLNIINDILDFTKIETGNLQLESAPFDLHSLCVDIINSLQMSANNRRNLLSLFYDNAIPEQLLGDKTRLYQVIINLIGNAIKFTENGKIDLIISLKKKDGDIASIYFEIRDTGIGIPKDKQSYIFETFTQARADISRKYGGTGLGLAITKRLLKLYQSEITVESTEGKGTVFSFAINFNVLSTSYTPPKQISPPTVFTGKRILVVDDNEVNILIAKRFLTKWGLVIDFAMNGEEAINKVMNNIYDLIFMDIRMPGIDGFDTTRIIREIEGEYFKSVPIIALTASTLHNENVKFKESGMNGHILKPFNPDEIKEVLTNYFKG
ncbi:MAG: PAS domain S-box protein [Pedobacter sp.]|nr:MAG: PAS domain S-box protein [Pedobacter sp.]